jgi:hypothetical protein
MGRGIVFDWKMSSTASNTLALPETEHKWAQFLPSNLPIKKCSGFSSQLFSLDFGFSEAKIERAERDNPKHSLVGRWFFVCAPDSEQTKEKKKREKFVEQRRASPTAPLRCSPAAVATRRRAFVHFELSLALFREVLYDEGGCDTEKGWRGLYRAVSRGLSRRLVSSSE